MRHATALITCALLISLQTACTTAPQPTPKNDALTACKAELEAMPAQLESVPPDARYMLTQELADTCEKALPGFRALLNSLTTPVAIEIPLPPHVSTPKPRPSAMITITNTGSAMLGDQELSAAPGDLVQLLLTHVGAHDPNAVDVVITADARVPYSRLIEVMDLLRHAGFTKIAIAVEKAP